MWQLSICDDVGFINFELFTKFYEFCGRKAWSCFVRAVSACLVLIILQADTQWLSRNSGEFESCKEIATLKSDIDKKNFCLIGKWDLKKFPFSMLLLWFSRHGMQLLLNALKTIFEKPFALLQNLAIKWQKLQKSKRETFTAMAKIQNISESNPWRIPSWNYDYEQC